MNYIDFAKDVEAARRGDAAAFEELYNNSVQLFRAAVYPMLKNEYDIEDVLQEAYVQIFKNLDNLEEPGAFIGWGRTICKNTALHHIRTAQRHWGQDDFRPSVSDDEYEGMDTLSVADERGDYADPQEQMDAAETKRLLDEMIGDLPGMQRLCIVLWQEGLTTAEIAERLAIPKGTVNSNVNYAKKKIKDKVLLLEKQGTKLYGLAPIPFFLWLMRQFEGQGVAAVSAAGNAASFSNIMRKAGSGKVVTGKAAVGGAAKMSAVKIAVIAVASTAVIGGASFAVATGLSTPSEETESAAEADAIPEEEVLVEESTEEEAVEEESLEEEVAEAETVEEEASSEEDDAVWIQGIYDALMTSDFEAVKIFILEEDFLERCESYLLENWRWNDYATAYRLPLEDESCVLGVVVYMDEENASILSSVEVFTGEGDGQDEFQNGLGYGDREFALGFDEEGTVTSEFCCDGIQCWFVNGDSVNEVLSEHEGRTVYYEVWDL